MKSGFVAIIGRPNVGKSTLINRLVGRKVAIVSDKPQTTRNRILGILTTDQLQVVFIDTPGIHKPHHKLGEYLVKAAQSVLEEVDMVLYMADASARPGAGEEFLLTQLRGVTTPVLLGLNKIDLVPKAQLLPLIDWYARRYSFAEIVPVSALTGDNEQELLRVIADRLTEGPCYYPPGQVADQPDKFMIGEIIREKVLRLTREEIPYSVAVTVEEMSWREKKALYLQALIYVERPSQRGILIGREGSMLKEIGSQARSELEAIYDTRVYLELTVKVKKDWRNDDYALHRFGYDRRNS